MNRKSWAVLIVAVLVSSSLVPISFYVRDIREEKRAEAMSTEQPGKEQEDSEKSL